MLLFKKLKGLMRGAIIVSLAAFIIILAFFIYFFYILSSEDKPIAKEATK